MSWLFIVIVAHFFYAGIFIIDRYLLKRGFPNPLSYAFFTGLLSVFVIVLAPFGFSIPATNQIILALATGIVWLLATLIFFAALSKGEASRVVPTVGGLIPLFTLGLSFMLLGERLSIRELIAFCLLVSGGIILSLLVTKASIFSNHREIHLTKAFIPALGAGFLFAVYYVMTKSVFLNQNLINGIIWMRLGAVLGALFLLIPSSFRKVIFKAGETLKIRAFGLFITARGLGAGAGFLIYWAVFLGSVTLVNALQGTQYLFLLLLAFFLFRKIPALKEQFSKEALAQKIIAIVFICLGLVILIV